MLRRSVRASSSFTSWISYFHVWIDVAAEMAVEQFQSAVGQLVGQQAAGEANFLVERFERRLLQGGVQPKIQLVRNQIPGTNPPMPFDAIAYGFPLVPKLRLGNAFREAPLRWVWNWPGSAAFHFRMCVPVAKTLQPSHNPLYFMILSQKVLCQLRREVGKEAKYSL